MAGKHSASSGGSKKPLVIVIIIVLVLALIAAGVWAFITFFNKKPAEDTSATTPTQAYQSSSQAQPSSTPAPSNAGVPTSPSATGEVPFGTEAEPTIGENIQIPTHGGEISYFNATYVPNGASDIATNMDVSLRDALGSDFRSSTITFNDDGTYVCNLGGLGTTTGMYLVEDGVITATDTTDRNLNITVTEWNEETNSPAAFYIIIGSETGGVLLTFSE